MWIVIRQLGGRVGDSFSHETCLIQHQNDPVQQGSWAETQIEVYPHQYEMAVSRIATSLALLGIEGKIVS